MRKLKNKYSRRTAANAKRKKILMAVLISIASVILVFAVAVGLGAFLRYKADGYTPKIQYDFEGNFTFTPNANYTVCSPIYNYGDYMYGFTGKKYNGISMYLGGADKVEFDSAVAAGVTGVAANERKLDDYTTGIHKYDMSACGYFYSSAFEITDENLRRLKKAYEISLLCEAASLGVDDILILGITVTESNVEEVAEYLSDINKGAGECKIGIAVKAEIFTRSAEEDYTARKLQAVCDFVAMDLRDLDLGSTDPESGEPVTLAEYLNTVKYYLDNETKYPYHARLVFSETNSSFLDEAYKLGFKNVQAVSNLKIDQSEE